jgi:AraC-like DNA-binding protein
VRFHLGRFPFSRLPLREARNRALPLDGLWEQQGLKAKIQALECRLAQEADTAERIACVERFLKEFLQHCSEPDTVVTEALDLIEETKGQISVEALAEAVGMSDRQLERKFTLHVGLLPKAFCRVARFRQVKSLLESALRPTSCDLAYACGYYDQTHLIREFRLFTGQTPAHYERVQSVGFFLYESQMTC